MKKLTGRQLMVIAQSMDVGLAQLYNRIKARPITYDAVISYVTEQQDQAVNALSHWQDVENDVHVLLEESK